MTQHRITQRPPRGNRHRNRYGNRHGNRPETATVTTVSQKPVSYEPVCVPKFDVSDASVNMCMQALKLAGAAR